MEKSLNDQIWEEEMNELHLLEDDALKTLEALKAQLATMDEAYECQSETIDRLQESV